MQDPRIHQINISDGGVPKLPVHEAEVTPLGLVGDRQANTKHHGGPERALCLYALERITALQGEGHPISPGSTGENLTLTGLGWTQVIPGTRLLLGDEVVIEITKYTLPCAKIAESFIDGETNRMAQEQHPGWSRVYAKVLIPGHLHTGDNVYILGD
ncbi:MAG: MOSC domain-containing protein [Anaerolineae bacterium]|jgi:MOSC domain-containing protein YiiM